MRNTVTENVTLMMKINEIRSISRHEMNQSKVFVIVEGEDDIKLFEKFIDVNKAFLYSAKSCLWVVKIIEELNNNDEFKSKCIGIKDADFDHIMNINYNIPNLFLTDYHDIEMTLMSENFENSLYAEYKIRSHNNIINEVSDEIKYISFIRMFNQIKVYEDNNIDGINFEGLNIGDIYNGVNHVDLNSCLNHIKCKGNMSKTWFPKENDILILEDSYRNIDLKQLTRGHDFMYSLRIKIKALSGHDMLGYKDLCVAFRIQLRKEEFMNTNLYSHIDLYSKQKGFDLWKT